MITPVNTQSRRADDGASSANLFAEVQAAMDRLPENAGPDAGLIATMKSAWASVRMKAADLNRVRGGRAAGELLSSTADKLLGMLLSFSARRVNLPAETPGIALLAMGSYGRRELALYSDIDILLLYSDETPIEKLEQLVGNLLRPLWDSGWQVGHSVRSPKECMEAMAEEAAGANAVETATSVLEARFVAGDQSFADAFYKQEVPKFFKRRGRLFVDAKFEETIKRWQGQSVYRTQPNIKESPGALRDFQLAMWIDQASQLSGHLPRLNDRPLVSKAAIEEAEAGYERLLTFRVSLHAICRRKQDVLDFQMQQAVAEDLCYESLEELKAPERLLRDYFRAATVVHRLAQTVTRRYLEERAIASRDIERLRRRKVDDDFTRVGDYLYASRNEVFGGDDWIEPAFRAYLHAARLGITVSQDVAESIRARLPGMSVELRCDPRAAQHFHTLMSMRENVAHGLRSMRDIGLLSAYMPEFGEIEGLSINDVFHDFTVDEHTLFVVEAVDRLYKSVEKYDQFRRQILEALPRPQILRMACLIHDLGKSRGGPGHSERGALMVPRIGERLGLSTGDVRTLIFLVQDHLTLSKVSQQRDPGEGGLLKSLAAKIGSRERLELLYLLTYCDSISVGQGSFPLWKDALLAELFKGILKFLTPAATPSGSTLPTVPDEATSLEARLVAQATTDSAREAAAKHCRMVPQRYLVEVNLEEALFHLETITRLKESAREAVAAVRGSGALVDMWVVSTDRPKRFSQICGSFLAAGVSVISAIAYTREDGIILDHFRLAPGMDGVTTDERFWAKVAASVEETLTGKGDFLARLESARRKIPHKAPVSRRIDPEIRVDNKLSERYTVVDVICGDRVGLLYGLSRALSDLSCDIHFAKIATNQGLVTDVFYISEASGLQVNDPEKMLNVKRLLKAVASDFQDARR